MNFRTIGVGALTCLSLLSSSLPTSAWSAKSFDQKYTFEAQLRPVLDHGYTLFAGAQPRTKKDYEKLINDQQVLTFISLRWPDDEIVSIEREKREIEEINQERIALKQAPLAFLNAPLGMLWKSTPYYLRLRTTPFRGFNRPRFVAYPTEEQLIRALKAIHDALQSGNVYVHCQYGKERTGVVSAAALVLLEGKNREEAFQEAALKWGFKKAEVWLYHAWNKWDLSRCGKIGQSVLGQGDCEPLPGCNSHFQ